MPYFTSASRLYEVMRHPVAHEIIATEIPELANSPILHALYGYPLGLVLSTEERLKDDQSRVAELLSRLTALDPSTVQPASNKTAFRPQPDYEPEGTPEGSAKASFDVIAAKWAPFEVELKGPEHGNPFADVDLYADLVNNGSKLSVPGFYDGNGTYRIRLLVPESGEWSFTTRSNARSLNGVCGTFHAGGAASHGVVRVAERFHFAYEDGTAYVPIGTTSYVWTHQGDALETETLATLAGGPFNKMRMCVFPKSYLFNENEPEIYPYEGSVAEGFDYLRPNPAFWAHLERRIDQLDELGIEADLILFHAYDRWGFSTMSPDQDDLFVKYAVARLASKRNIWWSLANEYDLMFEKSIEDWERYADIVTANDPNNHLLSIHNCREFYDHGRPWVTHCSIQRTDVYKTAEMITEWREQYGKPIVIDECAYEGNIDQGWGNITGEEMTRRFWEGALRGGYVGHGETFMDPDDVLWWAKGGSLKGTSPDRIGFLRRIMEEAPGGRLEPHAGLWDVVSAGIKDEYELIYFGFNQPTYRRFVKPQEITFTVDVIDTWNMTIETLPGTYSGRFCVELPGRQFVALRMRAIRVEEKS